MKPLPATSARALAIFAALVLFLGFLVPSPAGAFLAFGLAGLLALIPAILGPGKIRLAAALVALLALGLAAAKYPDFKGDQQRYLEGKQATPGK
jgi:hypothetical protein